MFKLQEQKNTYPKLNLYFKICLSFDQRHPRKPQTAQIKKYFFTKYCCDKSCKFLLGLKNGTNYFKKIYETYIYITEYYSIIFVLSANQNLCSSN